MEGNSNGSQKEGEAQQEGEVSVTQLINVTLAMGLEVFDCPVCFEPLEPPIFQCSVGHILCSSCRDEQPKRKCKDKVCSRAVSRRSRCYGMERVVKSILVPCGYAEHGCSEKIIYYQKEEHEEKCPNAPCFCPCKGCRFAGPTAKLLDHFTTLHKWPATSLKYYAPFDVPVKSGVHVLFGEDGALFLLSMSSIDAISIICVQPNGPGSRFGCSVGFSLYKGHYQLSTLDMIRSSSLSHGLPVDYFCIVAKGVVTITIDADVVDDDDELAKEDEEEDSYDEEEDGNGDAEGEDGNEDAEADDH